MTWRALLLVAAAASAGAEPRTAVADVEKLAFVNPPIITRGTALEQVRRTWAGLGGDVVEVRAFVAAPDELDAVTRELAMLAARRARPVALSVIGVAGVGHPEARAVLETALARRDVANPHGIAFVAGQPVTQDGIAGDALPFVTSSIGALKLAHASVQAAGGDVLRFTCLGTIPAETEKVRHVAAREFPNAAVSYVQLERSETRTVVECETVVRLPAAPGARLRLIAPDGLPKSANYSHVAALGPGPVAFTGMHLGKGASDEDLRAVFRSFDAALTNVGGSVKQVAMSSLYPTSATVTDLVRRTRFEFYDRASPPASTMLVFERLPGGASFGGALVAPVTRAAK